MVTGEKLYKIADYVSKEWLKYFESELEQYDLDFKFDKRIFELYDKDDKYIVKFTTKRYNMGELEIYLWGQKLPDDILGKDAETLSKFVLYCAEGFTASMGNDLVEGYSVTVSDNASLNDTLSYLGMGTSNYSGQYCTLYPYDSDDKILCQILLKISYVG